MKDKTKAVKKLGVLAKEKNVWMCVISVFILFLMLFPIFWMLNTSLKTETEIFQSPPTFYPHELNKKSYAAQWKQVTLTCSSLSETA